MPHDFLKEQPVQNVDVWLFRWILHNWSDKYCSKILRNLIPALKPGARVILCDNVLPEPGSLPQVTEDRLRSVNPSINLPPPSVDWYHRLMARRLQVYGSLHAGNPECSRT
jgi:hypothetical protein